MARRPALVDAASEGMSPLLDSRLRGSVKKRAMLDVTERRVCVVTVSHP